MSEETEKERIDREVIELLNEMRVVLPGVQVLFAFLLILPFQQGFAEVTDLERAIFLTAFASTTIATILLVGPVTYHRLRFRAPDKHRLLFMANRLVIAGTVFLAIAIGSSVYLIAEVVVGDLLAMGMAAATIVGLITLWYVLPLLSRTGEEG